jgi:hypothetical protein
MDDFFVKCLGMNAHEGAVFAVYNTINVKIIQKDGIRRPESCRYLCGKRKDMCNAAGKEEVKWGYCRQVQVL